MIIISDLIDVFPSFIIDLRRISATFTFNIFVTFSYCSFLFYVISLLFIFLFFFIFFFLFIFFLIISKKNTLFLNYYTVLNHLLIFFIVILFSFSYLYSFLFDQVQNYTINVSILHKINNNIFSVPIIKLFILTDHKYFLIFLILHNKERLMFLLQNIKYLYILYNFL